jgi:hypothetical protein
MATMALLQRPGLPQCRSVALRSDADGPTMPTMWDEPYLETCCRSALHRLLLSGTAGRPPGLKDGPCLARLAERGLAQVNTDGRYMLTQAGTLRHARDLLKRPATQP